MHTIIVGITGTGKTTLAKKLALQYQRSGTPVIVLDPVSRNWPAEFVTDDPQDFLDVVFAGDNYRCALFVDESGEMIGRYSGVMGKLATRSRHLGHKAHFIVQRYKQIDPTVRNQCTEIFLFKQSPDDTRELSREFVADELMEAKHLRTGEYLSKIGVDGDVKKSNIFLD